MRNAFERKVAASLGEDFAYEAVKLTYTVTHTYTPDFTNDAKELVEAKGRWTAQDRAKMKAIRDQHPDWNITMVFQNPNVKIRKGSQTTYGQWCDKNGIRWRKG